jgi:hypothetical protein
MHSLWIALHCIPSCKPCLLRIRGRLVLVGSVLELAINYVPHALSRSTTLDFQKLEWSLYKSKAIGHLGHDNLKLMNKSLSAGRSWVQ